MFRKFAGIAIALMLTACSAVGQSTFGSIVGVVHDKTQAVVPGASVQIRRLEDNGTRSTTSDQNGSFEFVNLKAGKYAVSVQAPGFADSQIPLAELTARPSLRVEVTMDIKSQTETVEVSDTVATVNTENGVIADSKKNKHIGQLPLNFRAVTTIPLATLATSANVQQDSQGNIALAGATANMVGYSVDGISTTNVFQSGAGSNPYPSAEGISELKVTAFNNSAEFSQVGDVTFTTKGGTNGLHGSLYAFVRAGQPQPGTAIEFSSQAKKAVPTRPVGGVLGWLLAATESNHAVGSESSSHPGVA